MLSDRCFLSKEKCAYFKRFSLENSFLIICFPTVGRKILSLSQELTVDLIYKLVEKDLECKVILSLHSSGVLC